MTEVESPKRRPTIFFDAFIIETPTGKKVRIHPVNAYAPNYKKWGVLATRKRDEQWYGQFVDIATEMDVCSEFVDVKFSPTHFLKLLKAKGYKVYWEKRNVEK